MAIQTIQGEYSGESEAAIRALIEQVDASPVPLAVVDYGRDHARRGSPSRFGYRDLRHVEGYRLAPVYFNKAARSKAAVSYFHEQADAARKAGDHDYAEKMEAVAARHAKGS